MKVKVINKSKYPLPEYKTAGSAGMDLVANLESPLKLYPGDRMLIPTGLFVQLPKNYEFEIRPRSGLALKNGITVLNTPGTIDSDYTGEIKVILINTDRHEAFIVRPGERIAQMVLKKVEKTDWVPVEELAETERGDGGFGHTGTE